MNSWSERNATLDRARSGPEIASLWGADPGSVRLVNDGINVVYRFTARGRALYLKVCSAANRSLLEQRAAAEFLQHLAGNGADVCSPVAALSGRLIEEYRQGGDTFLGWVTEEAPGAAISLDAPSTEEFRAWGVALGRMHRAAGSYAPAGDLAYLSWEDLWRETGAALDPADPEPARPEYEALTPWLRSLPRDPAVFGLTHTDVRSENAVWDGERVRIIDFDEPVWHWYASDVMRPFLEYAHLPRERFGALFDAFVSGYRSVRPFPERWVRELPRFARMKNLGFYWWHAHHSQRGQPGQAEWLRRVRRRFGAGELWLGPEAPGGGRRPQAITLKS